MSPRTRVMLWILSALAISRVLVGCASIQVTVTPACPPLKNYSAETQAQAAREIKGLGTGSAAGALIQDYGALRDQVRACRATK